MAYTFAINGVTKTLQPGFSIRESANGLSLFNGEMLSLDGSFRIEVNDEIVLMNGADIEFGGLVDQPAEGGFGGATATDAITLRVSAVDYNVLADRREVILDIPAGTVKDALIALDPYYDDYGVSLDLSQVDGPPLPALSFDGERLREVLDQISALSDHYFTWNISYSKIIGMYEIAANPAPFDVEDVDVEDFVDGDITVEQPTASDYANYITVLAGEGTRNIDFERHDGDGVTRSFVLDVTAIALIGALRIDGGPGGFPVGVYGVDTMEWTFDAATNAIIQDASYPVIAGGHYIEMSYTGQFPLEVFSDGGAAPADRVDKTYAEPKVFNRLVAQGLADAYRARDMRRPRTVRYGTYETGIHPGMTQLFDIAKRNLSGQFVITDVEAQNTAGIRVRRTVTAVEGEILPASIGETVMAWGGSSTGASSGGVVTVVSSGGVGGTGTAGQYAVWATSSTLTGATTIPESAIADGSILARVAANEIISGAWTFTSAPFIATTEPALYFYETDQGVNLKALRLDLQGGVLKIQSLTDAFAVQNDLWSLDRTTGAMAVKSGITAGSGAVGIIDSTGKIPAISSTYFASLSGANLTGVDLLGIVNTHTAAGTHTWSSASATSNRLFVENTTSGATAAASVRVTAGTSGLFLFTFSQGYTTSGADVANGSTIQVTTDGGLSINASAALSTVRMYAANTLAGTWASTGLTIPGTLGITGVSTHTGNGVFTANILPTTNYTSNIGAFTNKFLALYAAELWVETLVAQNTMATIGGRILVAPTNILTANLAAAGTTMTVKYNNFANGDRVYMEANGQLEWIAIASAAGGSAGAYTYTVTRSLDPGSAANWSAGDAVLNTGTTGSGFIDLYSTAGVLTATGPAIVGNVRTGTTYNQIAPRWAVGNLNGVGYGHVTDIYGAAFGDASATNITIDATNGFRIRSSTTNKFVADTSGNLSIVGDLSVGTAGVIRSNATAFGTGTGYWLDYNSGTPRLRVGTVSGNRISWDGTDFVLVSSTVSIGSGGITLSPAGGYSGSSAYKFTRNTALGFGAANDVFGMWGDDSSDVQQIVIQNTVKGTGTSYGNAFVTLSAAGWDRIGLGNFGTAAIDLESTQTNPGRVTVTAASGIRLQHTVTTSHTFKTGTGSDTTSYTQSNANLLTGNNGEALGIAGTSALVNLNFYLNTVAQRKATIQAVGGVGAGNNGGRLLFFTKDDAASGTDVVQAGYIDFSTGGAGGGLVWGAPTGGSKGAGTINCKACYDDNTLLTDWVYDLWHTGKTTIRHAGCLYTVAEVERYARDERRLPWMPDATNFESRRSLGELVTNLWQGAEQMMVYLFDHEAQIVALKAEIAQLKESR